MTNQKVVSQIGIPVKCDLLLVVSIIRQESAFNPRAVSKAGAKGLMQIMPPTWGEWVRIIGIKAADPFNPLHNIMVGCAELNRQISNFEDLRLALTAYNWGSGNLRKLIREKGTSDFEQIKDFMPKEAREYAQRIFKHYNDPLTVEYLDDFKGII